MSRLKENNLEIKAIRKSAKGSPCSLNIAGVCNQNPETTVLCHVYFGYGLMGGKSDDFSAVHGCSACHDYLDGNKLSSEEKYFYTGRALIRTYKLMRENGTLEKALAEIKRKENAERKKLLENAQVGSRLKKPKVTK